MKNILITGAGSGMGLKTSQLLAKNGFHVYAGARKPAELDFLNTIPNVIGIRLDVCEPHDLDNFANKIKNDPEGLFGVVNNAGIFNMAPIFTHKLEVIKKIFDVNVFGMCRVITAVLPFLLKSKGRIVNVSSLSGFLTHPNGGAYCMSKHAVEAYSDGLHFDLAEKGIKVSVIEPGSFSTKIGKKMLQNVITHGISDYQFVTQAEYEQIINLLKDVVTYFEQSPEPDMVAEAILHAFTADTPRRRYLVGTREELSSVIERMFQEIGQLNGKHNRSLRREELIAYLDKYLE